MSSNLLICLYMFNPFSNWEWTFWINADKLMHLKGVKVLLVRPSWHWTKCNVAHYLNQALQPAVKGASGPIPRQQNAPYNKMDPPGVYFVSLLYTHISFCMPHEMHFHPSIHYLEVIPANFGWQVGHTVGSSQLLSIDQCHHQITIHRSNIMNQVQYRSCTKYVCRNQRSGSLPV